MREHSVWSNSLGRWWGVEVRVHMFHWLFIAFTMLLCFYADKVSGVDNLVTYTLIALGILTASVLAHEIGHCLAASRLGGGGDRIVLWPLGGLAPVRTPPEPQGELLVHLSGPLVNLVICVTCIPVIFALDSGVNLPALLHPLNPGKSLLAGSTLGIIVKLTFWINWVLLLVNLLPAFPFDGGRVLRAGIVAFVPDADRRLAAGLVAQFAKFAFIGLLILAWFCRDMEGTVPPWFALVLLAILLFFSAKHEENRQDEEELENELFGYDFSQGYTSLERSLETDERVGGPISRWLERRRIEKNRRRLEIEADEEQRLDDVLERLHATGMDNLSPEDRSLLNRVSARLRDRKGDHQTKL